jgi:hypothetical protein
MRRAALVARRRPVDGGAHQRVTECHRFATSSKPSRPIRRVGRDAQALRRSPQQERVADGSAAASRQHQACIGPSVSSRRM